MLYVECGIVQAISDDRTTASVATKFCRKAMSSSTIPVDSEGNSVGGLITITDTYGESA